MLIGRTGALALLICLLAGEAGAITGIAQRHWRRRAHVPPLPYPEFLYPEEPPPLPSGFTMTITKGSEPVADAAATPRDIARRFASCWSPPAISGAVPQVTVRFQLARSGAIIGRPQVTYVAPGRTREERNTIATSMLEAMRACAPLRFTGNIGEAIAGYPFAIRFIASAPPHPQQEKN